MVMCTVPFAFLAGLLRSRVAGAAAVSEVVARLGDPTIRQSGIGQALADALDGTSLEVAYLDPDGGYVDAAGRQVAVPRGKSDRVAIPLEATTKPAAVLTYDGSREGEQELVRAVTAAATLALENERLASELRGKVDEVIASRARIVESGDAARRRLERDLHDGAQQRLVSLALNLRVLGSRVDGDPDAARQLELAVHELDQALEDLRELAVACTPRCLRSAASPRRSPGWLTVPRCRSRSRRRRLSAYPTPSSQPRISSSPRRLPTWPGTPGRPGRP